MRVGTVSRQKSWYVVATKPAAESAAARHLANQHFDVFLPQYKKVVRHSRRVYPRLCPFFPGYLFVSFAQERNRWRAINGTYGVRHLIAQNERPVPLPAGFTEMLMARANPDGVVELKDALKAGDKVEILSGPFACLTGQLLSIDERGRVAVLLELLSRSVPVRTSVDNLLPAA